jgi:hypothetical protein
MYGIFGVMQNKAHVISDQQHLKESAWLLRHRGLDRLAFSQS